MQLSLVSVFQIPFSMQFLSNNGSLKGLFQKHIRSIHVSLSGFLKHVGTWIKRFSQFMSQKCFLEFSSIPTLKFLWKWSYHRFCYVHQWPSWSIQGDLKLNFYEGCKNYFLSLKPISTEILSIMHFNLHCNKRDGMLFNIFVYHICYRVKFVSNRICLRDPRLVYQVNGFSFPSVQF